MTDKYIGCQNIVSNIPKDSNIEDLRNINGIYFTPKEANIIACIIGGRSSKRIAALLSISPKTVSNHIQNIMSKIKCNSRESIIDFIEKSGKFALVKKHYLNLSIQASFELELKRISGAVKKQDASCLILYSKEKNESAFVHKLQKHLDLMGIKTSLEINEEHEHLRPLDEKIKSQRFNYIIYILPSKFMAAFEKNNNFENIVNSEFTQTFNRNSGFTLFLWPEKIISCDIPKKCANFNFIVLQEQEDYHSIFLKILKEFVPNSVFDKSILEFSKNYETLIGAEKPEFQQGKETAKPFPILVKIRNISLIVILIAASCGWLWSQSLNKNSIGHGKIQDIQVQQEGSVNITNWNLPRQDHVFIGRKKLLENLYNELHNKEELELSNTLAITACAGLGGIGKTQLALQYLYHTKHPYTLKAWFPSENIDNLRKKYIDFARYLGYTKENATDENIINYIKGWLASHPGWILVYDNVHSYSEIEPFLPTTGGHVILTTRNQSWPTKFKVLSIDVMTEEEAIDTIKIRSHRNIKNEMDETKKLVKTLGYLPLALAQAGSYIQQNGVSILEYLNLYRKHEEELVSLSSHLEENNSRPVSIVWNITLDVIVKEAKANGKTAFAIELLTVCAYLAPEKISRQLLLTWLQKAHPELKLADLVLNENLRLLWQYSMINFDDSDITVHRLIQSVLRHQHQHAMGVSKDSNLKNLNWFNMLLEAADDEFKTTTSALEDEQRKRKLLPHLQSLERNYRNLLKIESPSLAKVLSDIACVLFQDFGQYVDAHSYYKNSFLINKHHYGDKHIKSILSLVDLANTFVAIGNANEGRKLLESILPALEAHFGSEHVEIAKAAIFLSRAYKDLGDIKQQQKLLERALKIQEHNYGTDHIEVAKVLDELGVTFDLLGNIAMAKHVLERALSTQINYYGSDHIIVAKTLDSLGTTYDVLGDMRTREFLQKSLTIKERHYGSNHISVAITLANLGNAYRIFDPKQSKKLLERALKINQAYFGEHHPEVALVLTNLGNTYNEMGNALYAKTLLEKSLKIQEQYYDKNNPEIAKTLAILGNSERNLGNVIKAEFYLKEAIKRQENYYGDEHPIGMNYLADLSSVYKDIGKYEQAKVLYERVLVFYEKYYGKDHPEIAALLENLGNVYKVLGNAAQAKIAYERSLKIKMHYFGKDHPGTLKVKQTMNN